MNESLPTRILRKHPDLDQLKRQAKELLNGFLAGQPDAVAEVNTHYHDASASDFALHDAQLVIARAYGFESWPKLKGYVDGVTVGRLAEAVRSGDIEAVRAILQVRPELVDRSMSGSDEDRALHYAVLQRNPAIVRLLMQHGADARGGIYPHREATGPLTLAVERGYEEIAAIIREEEHRRQTGVPKPVDTDLPSEIAQAFQRGDEATIMRFLEKHPELIRLYGDEGLLSLAVRYDHPETLALLLDLGFDPDERRQVGWEPPEYTWGQPLRHCAEFGKPEMAKLLLARGADPNAHIYAGGTPVYAAYGQKNQAMIDLLESHGAFLDAECVGDLGLAEKARQMLDDEAAGQLRPGIIPDWFAAMPVAEVLLVHGAGKPQILQMALERIDRGRRDPWWFGQLSNARGNLACLRAVLDRCDPNVRGPFGRTILHDVAADWCSSEDRTGPATMLLNAGAKLDARDDLLKSTPLGWACRWGCVELVKLYLSRGADAIEVDAEPWARPRAWAEKMKRAEVLAVLREHEH